MSLMSFKPRWTLPALLLVGVLTARGQPVAVPADAASAAPGATPALSPAVPALPADAMPSAPNAAEVSFATGRTVLWLHHTAIIPLRLKSAPAASDATYAVSASDPAVLQILRTPVFLAGEQAGYMRVRALRAGPTRLSIHGGPVLDVEVKPDPAEAVSASVDPESRRPRIISPMPGAVVWGEFGVGVSMFESPAAVQADGWFTAGNTSPASSAAPAVKVQLRLPNGRLLDPISETAPEFGPERQYQFSVAAADLPVGPLQLVAVASGDGLDEPFKSSPASALESAPFEVRVAAAPAAANYWSGECESPGVLGITKSLYAPARPYRFGIEVPQVASDPTASGGKMVRNPTRGWCLPFVAPTAGDYQMLVQARADFAGGAYPSAGLYLNNQEEPSGLVRIIGSKYRRVPIGTPVHLDAGPQILSVEFRNTFGQGKENRTLYLDSYEVARVGDGTAAPTHPEAKPQKTTKPSAPVAAAAAAVAVPGAAPVPAPQLSILYPANGAQVFGADAVVAKATGSPTALLSVDVLIDGEPARVPLQKPAAGEPMILPLVLRDLMPGDHTLEIRATTALGQIIDSPARAVTVSAQAPAARGPYERAVWLLDRLAFGPEPKELAAILTQGESKWLAAHLLAPFNNPAEQAVLARACQHYKRLDDGGQTVNRALEVWLETANPVRARFTAWAENHFSTWMSKTKPDAKWYEHLMFARLGIAPFADLLKASAHSPAMLTYLDQEKSYAGKLNENYAREIMELHTLGVHGGYAQADVTELAYVLNGWTLADEAALPESSAPAFQLIANTRDGGGLLRDFRFVPALNDGKPRRVLGLQFPAADPTRRYDRVHLALEMLSSHPSTAEHVCRKLAEHYVGTPAPDALVRHLATSFLESGGDMRVVLFTMVGDPEFWSAGPKIATPFDYALRTARLGRDAVLEDGLSDDQAIKPEQIESFLKHSGMGLFDRVTPDGYPENSGAYADSNALLQRWRFMQSQTPTLSHLVPLGWRSPLPPLNVNGDAETDPVRAALSAADAAQRFIDLAAIRLTGRLLTPGSNQTALEVLGKGAPDDLQQALIFVSLLPETSLR